MPSGGPTKHVPFATVVKEPVTDNGSHAERIGNFTDLTPNPKVIDCTCVLALEGENGGICLANPDALTAAKNWPDNSLPVPDALVFEDVIT